jgi:hypothetical protein
MPTTRPEPNIDLDSLRARVREYLSQVVSDYWVSDEGDYAFDMGSARIFVRTVSWGDRTLVRIFSPILRDAPASDALFRFVATSADEFVFGHLSVDIERDQAYVILAHTLLGDYLDAEELHTAVAGLAATADELDNFLQKRFGGHLFHQ